MSEQSRPTDLVTKLGLRTLINGVGPATRLGGLPLHPEVLDAMSEATSQSVRMDELEVAVGQRLATLLEIPGAYVTAGAAAALGLGAATLMTGGDARLVDALPDTRGLRCEFVIQHAQRDPYDRAVTSTGARLVEIGYPMSTHPDELDRAINADTAGVLFRPGRPGDLLSLRQTTEIAHARGVPVLVDGALFVPPVDRLRSFFADGADLVAVSGGKGFRGPQGSGMLCGHPDLVAGVALHHQDMDERPETWQTPNGRLHTRTSPPRHGIGRAMKIGREQVLGLLAAVERYQRDPGADDAPGCAELDALESALADAGRVAVTRRFDEALNVPELHVEVGTEIVDEAVRLLASGEPSVVLGEALAWRGTLTVNPMALMRGYGQLIAERLGEVVVRLTSASAG